MTTQVQGKITGDVIPGYHPSDWDDTGDPSYYGFLDKDGAWYIMRMSDSEKSIRYVKNRGDYTIYWGNRSYLEYKLFDLVF